MKKILYVTGSRAEYGIMKRLLQQLKEDDSIDSSIVATGMHCDKKYGMTYKVIENDGFRVDKIIDIEINNDTNAEIIKPCRDVYLNLVYIFKIISLML